MTSDGYGHDDMAGLALARWRLILGRFAEESLPGALGGEEARLDAALDYLYGREYHGRGMRDGPRHGGLEGSRLTLPDRPRPGRPPFPPETGSATWRPPP